MSSAAAATPIPTTPPVPPALETRTHAWKAGKDGAFQFGDLIDAVNPLQHVPVISAIYRRLTGDVPGNVAQLVGDTLYGGPIGLGVGLFGIALKEETGKDPGEMALGLLVGSDTANAAAEPAAAAPQVAAKDGSQAIATSNGGAPAAPAVAQPPSTLALAPVAPAHPPIPLHRAPVTAPSTVPGNAHAAENAFMAQSTLLHRGLAGSRVAPGAARTFTAPIPLQLSGQAASVMPLRPPPRAAAPPAPTPTPAAAGSLDGPPSDIARRMQEALDKYQRLEAQHAGAIDLRQ